LLKAGSMSENTQEVGIKRRILFVDDEVRVLEGLENMLHTMRHEWDMRFADNGAAALELVKAETFDLVVSDMRMPHMDGVQLLTAVEAISPATVRFILSGHSDRDMILRSVGPTHQFLVKPCDADQLKTAVSRAFSLRDMLGTKRLANLVLDIKRIPALPVIYDKVCKALNSGKSSLGDIGALVAQDVAMSAKILQLVNSSFFGLRHRIDSMPQAATMLGLDTLRGVVLAAGVFETFKAEDMKEFEINQLYDHCISTGRRAHRVAKVIGCEVRDQDEALLAGLIHDLGQIVLIRNHHAAYGPIWQRCIHEKLELSGVEREVLGASHAEVGAYVLGLWGIPDAIVETVAVHHAPGQCLNRRRGTLTAVYLADRLDFSERTGVDMPWMQPALDTAYLADVGVVMAWEKLQQTTASTL
jgi:putative nucleotidyltransferase with HDIG domain